MNDLVSAFAANKLPSIGWLRSLQEKQLEAFLARGFPTRNEELWKYTDMLSLSRNSFAPAVSDVAITSVATVLEREVIKIVFVNGYYKESLSDLTLLPKGVILCPISQALISHEHLLRTDLTNVDAERHPFASLNTALMTDGIFLFVPENIYIATPIHCLFVSTKLNNFFTCPRNIIRVGVNSQITVVEEYVGMEAENYLNCPVTKLSAENNAKIYYHKIQSEAYSASHLANIFVDQSQDSVIKSFCLAAGSRLAREDINVALQAPGAECQLHGFYHLTQDAQHIDNHVHIDHLAHQGSSAMQYKGILNKKSKAVFNGKVFVQKNAQQNNAHQTNHNLLLSNDSEVNTKPELEIYADDVKCTHGATIGQLDTEALFYLRARGIDEESAKKLLINAFAVDAFDKIENDNIRQYIQDKARIL